jgi:exoribonuclease R
MLVATLEVGRPYKYGMSSRGVPSWLAVPFGKKEGFYAVGCKEKYEGNMLCVIRPTGATGPAGTTESIKIPRADLVRIIGRAGQPAAEREAALLHYAGIQTSAKKKELDAAALGIMGGATKTLGGFTFNIDPAGCKDVDDVITIEKVGDAYAVTISISDVAHYIGAGTVLDEAAAELGQTYYDAAGTVLRPMLPAVLSEGTLSLLPGVARRVISLSTVWDSKTLVIGEFSEQVVVVDRAYTYDSFCEAPVELVDVVRGVANSIMPSDDSHKWVEALMILYNMEAAKRLRAAGGGLLRSQSCGVAPIEELRDAAKYCHADADHIHSSMGGLYCHATSPIRRYADIVNQRILKGMMAVCDPAALNEAAKRCRRFGRDMCFMEALGRDSIVEGIVYDIGSKLKVYIREWKQFVSIRAILPETVQPEIGDTVRLKYVTDPQKRRWKDRIVFQITE